MVPCMQVGILAVATATATATATSTPVQTILGFNEHSTVALHVRCNGGAFRCCFLKNNNVKRPNSKFCEEHEHTTGHLTTLANSSARL